jgi:hypothetical protein
LKRKFLINKNTFFKVHSWWPWRFSIDEGKCILRTQDGWLKRPCNEFHAFICERDINQQSIPLTVRCGNAQASLSSTIITTTTTAPTPTTSTRRPTVAFIQPPIVHEDIPPPLYKQQSLVPSVFPSINKEQEKTTVQTKSSSIDPSINKFYYFNKTFFSSFLDILAAVLGGVAIAIFSVNIIVCYICKRYR